MQRGRPSFSNRGASVMVSAFSCARKSEEARCQSGFDAPGADPTERCAEEESERTNSITPRQSGFKAEKVERVDTSTEGAESAAIPIDAIIINTLTFTYIKQVMMMMTQAAPATRSRRATRYGKLLRTDGACVNKECTVCFNMALERCGCRRLLWYLPFTL